jgi:hypothetical protein
MPAEGRLLVGRSPVPVRLLEAAPWVLGSTDDSKADGCDGSGDFQGESFGSPVFVGVRRSKLAHKRSWPEAEPAVLRADAARAGGTSGVALVDGAG